MNPHDYINSFANYETKLHTLNGRAFDLSRVSEVLDLLDAPQNKLKIIHVAGTKGKGSTCAFLSQILAASGYKVGLYTSPHLHQLNERIRILDAKASEHNDPFAGMITDEELNMVISAIRPMIASMTNRGSYLTYFEVLTVIAFYYFHKQNVDWVVLETGLGGRLDATNSCESMIAVITQISFDHVHILGKTLTDIAAEKAGIIKNCKQRVVIAPQEQEAMDVILKRCREFGIPPIIVDPDKYKDLDISLKGDHQRINAATALYVIELLKMWNYKFDDEVVARSIRQTKWAGRFELLSRKPDIIIDAAHNQASAQAVAKTVQDEYRGKKVICVIGLSTDKDIDVFAQEIKTIATLIICTKADHPRAHAFTESEAKKLFKGKEWSVVEHLSDAIALAKAKAQKDDVILITGSMYVIAQARQMLLSSPNVKNPSSPNVSVGDLNK